MIGLDTNVLVRILVEDDKRQLHEARRVLEEAAERKETVFLSEIVLSELEWVLEDTYKVPRRLILQSLQALVANDLFDFEDRGRLVQAIELYQKRKGDLSDYLIGLCASGRGARTTYTFDRSLRHDERFTFL